MRRNRNSIPRVREDLSSKKIVFGLLDLGNPEIEPGLSVVADRIRNGLEHVSADRLIVAPDCGMKTCPPHRIRQTEGDVRCGGNRPQRDQLPPCRSDFGVLAAAEGRRFTLRPPT
jgi:hypothetical protein